MKYIIRLDDIAVNMNWDNFYFIKDILIKENIKPVIGVIPCIKDKRLLKYPKCKGNFWGIMRYLQRELDWTIALHGCTHEFTTDDGGILKFDMYSEFAGIPYKRQFRKIKKGKEIFGEHGISTDVFMPPANSFDKNTLKALYNNQIYKVMDGYGFLPYSLKGVLLVPFYIRGTENIPFSEEGVATYVVHLNNMNRWEMNQLVMFIRNNRENIISLSNIERFCKVAFTIRVWNTLVRGYYMLRYLVKSVVNPHTLKR